MAATWASARRRAIGRWTIGRRTWRARIWRSARRRREPRHLVAVRVHALSIHDVELLLQRHLRKASTAGAQRRADDGAGGRADPGTTAGIAVPAAAADSGAEARSEGR